MKWTLAICLSVLLLAVPAQADPRSDSRTQTIRLVSKIVSFRILVNRPPKNADNVGDKVRAKNSLRNAVAQFGRPRGALVGSDVETITVTSVMPTRARVTVVVTLPGGTLRVAGPITSSNLVLPVIGGTGDFAGARGTSEVKSLDADGDPALNVYRLRLP
jgi:Dirigent-like protein